MHKPLYFQGLVRLAFTVSASQSGTLSVTAPPHANVAPPGYYMLFLLNRAGVPSRAQFIQLSPIPANQPPTGTILSPAGDVTITAGQEVRVHTPGEACPPAGGGGGSGRYAPEVPAQKVRLNFLSAIGSERPSPLVLGHESW